MYARRQIFDHAAATIAVPPELQNRSIEVIFMALESEAVTPSGHPLMGDYLMSFFKNIPSAQSPEEELVIEPRSQQQDRPVDFE